VNRGGTLAPGAGTGTLTVAGPVTFAAAGAGLSAPTLSIELQPSNATNRSDLLALTGIGANGALTLANPDTLNLLPLESIATRQVFTIATFASQTGIFDNVFVNGFATQSLDDSAANFVQVTYNPTNIQVDVANVLPVPEPASIALLLVAGMGILNRRRRA
jgi:hypothetical protein